MNSIPYRHGVLIGNWNEDEFGVQLSSDQGKQYDPAEQYSSIAKASYRPPPLEATTQVAEDNTFTHQSRTQVEHGLLFGHDGVNHPTSFYLTSYNSSWGNGGNGQNANIADPSLKQTLWRKTMSRVGDPSKHQNRRMVDYSTTSQTAHSSKAIQDAAKPSLRYGRKKVTTAAVQDPTARILQLRK